MMLSPIFGPYTIDKDKKQKEEDTAKKKYYYPSTFEGIFHRACEEAKKEDVK